MKDVDFFTPGARLALELECLLLDTRNDAAQSRWWDSAHEALEQWRQAVMAMEASIDAVQPEASTTLEEAASHARVCSGLAEQYKRDAVLFAALTDAAAIIRDLMRDRLGASATGAGQAEIEALRQTLEALKAENEKLREALKDADNELDWLDGDMDTCDHSVGVCMCDYWNMRRNMKAALTKESNND